MSTGLGIAVAGLLIAGAVLYNGYMDRRPYNRAFDNCMAELQDSTFSSTPAQNESVCLNIAAKKSR
jgi:hypothetical protein